MTEESVCRDIASMLSTAVAAVDDDGTYVFVNDSFARMFDGQAPEVGKVIFDGSDPEHNSPFVEALRATIADGEPRSVRNTSEDVGGTYDNLLNRRNGITVIEVRDVTTERDEAERRRRMDAARAITWALSDTYFMVVDVVGGTVEASDSLWRYWPVDQLERLVASGRVLEGLQSPTSYADPWLSLESANDGRVERAIAEVFTTGQEQRHHTVVPMAADDIRHIDVGWVPWVADGIIRGAIMIGHDVTPRVLAEQRELVARATMQELLDRLPVTLWELDRADGMAWPLFPDRREQPDPAWGQHAPLASTFAFMSEESIERLTTKVAGMPCSGQETLTVTSVDGQRRMQLSLSSVESVVDGSGGRVLLVITDVTQEFVEAETDRRMDHATHVMRFAQGVAHDFGNVAQVIGGYSEMLAKSQDPAIVEQASRRLQSAAMRAVEVSRRIAKIAKVQQVVNGPVDISEVVGEQVALLQQEVDPALSLTVTVQPDLVGFAERQQVASAVENLCLNAAQAMDHSGSIHVDCSPVTDRGRDYVEVTVTDDGPGVPAGIIDRVFDPFVTGRPSTGTGLGLYLIQEYCYSVGGQVHVENAAQGGAVFRMRFQLARAHELRGTVAAEATHAGVSP